MTEMHLLIFTLIAKVLFVVCGAALTLLGLYVIKAKEFTLSMRRTAGALALIVFASCGAIWHEPSNPNAPIYIAYVMFYFLITSVSLAMLLGQYLILHYKIKGDIKRGES